jgi:hypothetical protein
VGISASVCDTGAVLLPRGSSVAVCAFAAPAEVPSAGFGVASIETGRSLSSLMMVSPDLVLGAICTLYLTLYHAINALWLDYGVGYAALESSLGNIQHRLAGIFGNT